MLRYLLAVAYCFFIAILGIWFRTRSHDYLDLVDVPGGLTDRAPQTDLAQYLAGGGDFGGAGASSAFEGRSSAAR